MDWGRGRIQLLKPLAWNWGPGANRMVAHRVKVLRPLTLFNGLQITDLGRF